MKRLKRILVPLAMVAAYFAVEPVLRYRAVPPAGVRTLDEYLNWQTRHARWAVLAEKGGRTSLLMYGSRPAPFEMAGPPVYVFDASGRLVDWTTAIAWDGRFQHQWLSPPMRATRVPPGDARERLAAAATRPAS